jgi:hypothetical protein
MNWKRIGMIIAAVVASSMVIAIDIGDLYSEYWYADLVAHFLAGLSIATVISLGYKVLDSNHRFALVFTVVTLGIVAIASLWELFEVWSDSYSGLVEAGLYDTVTDILAVVAGAWLHILIAKIRL